MSSCSGDEKPAGQSARAMSLADADRALLLASVAWGDRHRRLEDASRPNDTMPDLLAGLNNRLAPVWLRTLDGALDRDVPLAGSNDPLAALEELRTMQDRKSVV